MISDTSLCLELRSFRCNVASQRCLGCLPHPQWGLQCKVSKQFQRGQAGLNVDLQRSCTGRVFSCLRACWGRGQNNWHHLRIWAQTEEGSGAAGWYLCSIESSLFDRQRLRVESKPNFLQSQTSTKKKKRSQRERRWKCFIESLNCRWGAALSTRCHQRLTAQQPIKSGDWTGFAGSWWGRRRRRLKSSLASGRVPMISADLPFLLGFGHQMKKSVSCDRRVNLIARSGLGTSRACWT